MSISLKDIHKGFGEQLVLNHISLDILAGELLVLLGSSGSGKSTLLRVIAGLLSPDSGTVSLDGRDVTAVPPQQRNVGFVFQQYALFRNMNVYENVEFGLKVRGVPWSEARLRSEELLEQVGLGGLGLRMPSQLSGGQRQRVALARALAFKPTVLLLDEPFGALDAKIRGQLRRNLKDLQKQLGVTTILVTHDQEEAFELGNRIGVLERGKLVEVGTPQQLYHAPRTEYVATFVGGGNVLVGRAEKSMIRLGAALLPFPAEAPPHEEGAPVRMLFRPEVVRHQPEPFGDASGFVTIGQGRVIESNFAGPTARIRFELETLRGVRPLVPALNYGQRFASIESSQPSSQDLPRIGEVRTVALARYHVLEPSGLRFLINVDGDTKNRHAFKLGAQLVAASHGSATVLSVIGDMTAGDDMHRRQEQLRKLVLERRDLRLEARVRHGLPSHEVVREVQEGYFDIVVLDRSVAEDHEEKKQLAHLARRVLAYAGAPVLFTGKGATGAISRILICTAGGEPGKNDVRVAARLARHIGGHATVFHVLGGDAGVPEQTRVKRHLSQAQDLLSVFNVTSDVKLGQGLPFPAILKEIDQGAYDLLVLGASWSKAQFRHHADELVTDLIDQVAQAALIVPTFE